ncbi:MAG: hypothetical protein E4H16_04545 [Candidatus Atribacteria bacterium]|nr:MAG: hypothetical protein E4H16_04545 [Candidatus Atribacteria bacterium]
MNQIRSTSNQTILDNEEGHHWWGLSVYRVLPAGISGGLSEEHLQGFFLEVSLAWIEQIVTASCSGFTLEPIAGFIGIPTE